MQNELDFLCKRRSIRSFKPRPVSKALIQKIVRAAQRAPTACGMQMYSFVAITDQQSRQRISDIIGRARYLEESPVWIVVCADLVRQSELFRLLGLRTNFQKMSKLIPAIVDATLAAENMVIAAEMLGLGSVFVGGVWKGMKRIADILNLPKDVLPLVLLCLGYPNEKPLLKPRWPLKAVLHENTYRVPSEQVLKGYYERANRELVKMKYFRKGIATLAEHWYAKFNEDETAKQESVFREDLPAMGYPYQ